MSTTAIVILNWNGRNYLERFLPFLLRYTPGKDTSIIVADNASDDDSISFLEKNYPDVGLIVLDRNYGFAGGYNKALEKLDFDYFLLLNSDIEVSEGWLEPLVKTMDANPLIAGCSPKLMDFNQRDFFEYAGAAGGFMDRWGYAFCRGRLFDSVETDYGQYNDQRKVFWVTGACMMVRAELFKLSGGFDDDYFAHFEEIDLCWRLGNRGYSFVYVPDSCVYHIGGGTLPASNPRKTYLNFRNNLFTIYKNTEPKLLLKTIFIRLLMDGLSSLRFLLKFDMKDFTAVFRAHLAFYRKIGGLKQFRKKELPFVKNYISESQYQGSIVLDYFLRKKKSYSSLKWNPGAD